MGDLSCNLPTRLSYLLFPGEPPHGPPRAGMARASCGVSGGRSLFSEEPG